MHRALVLSFATLLVAPRVLAQTEGGGTETPTTQEDPARVAQARDAYREGVSQFRSHHYGDALVAFERSFRLRPHPTTLYNVAEARLRAGDPQGAVEQLRQLLAMTSPAPDAQTIERARGLAREAGVDDLQPASANQGPECPVCPVCAPQHECPTCPPAQPVAQDHGVLPFVLAGGSVAFLAAGMIFYGVALGDAGAYNDVRGSGTSEYYNALSSQGSAFRVVGLVGIVLGALSGVGAIWTYTHPPASSTHAEHAPAAEPSPAEHPTHREGNDPEHERPSRRSTPHPIATIDVAPNGIVITGTF